MISGGLNGAILLIGLLYPMFIMQIAATGIYAGLLLAEIAMIFGPYILGYIVLVDECGKDVANAYVKCLAKIIGIDIFINIASDKLHHMSSVFAKGLGKFLHYAGIALAIFEFYECNDKLAMTCKDDNP